MNKIGIIFAMEEEINSLKQYFIIDKEYKIYELTFFEGKINDKICYLVQSGVGKVNAARTTQILIDKFDVDCVFNIGVAGGVDSSLHVGDIVIGDKLYQHDFDITAFDHNKGYIPNIGDYVESDTYLIEQSSKVKEDGVVVGSIASGDIFITEDKMSSKINNKFNVLCVEMEGASVAQVCKLCNIPFIIIRSISDIPNNDNKITYEEFLIPACKKVSSFVFNIINNI